MLEPHVKLSDVLSRGPGKKVELGNYYLLGNFNWVWMDFLVAKMCVLIFLWIVFCNLIVFGNLIVFIL